MRIRLRALDGATLLLLSFFAIPDSVLAAPLPIGLTRIASQISSPIFVTAPRGDERLYVVERAGLIRVQQAGQWLAVPFVDLSALVAPITGEFGLLSLAFPPDVANSRVCFVFYTARSNDPTLQGSLTLARLDLSADLSVADLASLEVLWSVPKPPTSGTDPTPRNNHNGGTIAFDSSGVLWMGTGDGGGSGDPDDLAQSDASPFGKLFRIDFGGDLAHAMPAVTVHAKGLRNPFRFSIDRATDDLWIGDVGQSAREEIDWLPAGSAPGTNFGWRCREGFIAFDEDPPCALPLRDPVHDYTHATGVSVTGGVRYRGVIPELRGRYFFADFIGRWWSFEPSGPGGFTDLQEHTAITPPAGRLSLPVAITEDGFGELVITDLDGELFRVVPTAPDADGDRVPDSVDLCPFAADPAQLDRGGIGAGSAGDGIGDACQCGDVTGDGRVTIGDAVSIQRSLLVPPTATLSHPERCDVAGTGGACSTADAIVIRRALLSPPSAAITQQCAPALP